MTDAPSGFHTCGGVLSADDPSITVPMPIAGRVRDIDCCIAAVVAALNAGGIRTVASCCGHGRKPGSIALDDGRWLLILDDDEARRYLDG